MTTTAAMIVDAAGGPSRRGEVDLGELGHDEVEIEVATCGVCHSDLSLRDDAWRRTSFPFVGGHEVVGTVVATGAGVPASRAEGTDVGLGWFAHTPPGDPHAIAGRHNLGASTETIIGRHGGFADRVRAQWTWVTPLPEGLDRATAGPLFCAGATVFGPIVDHGVQPTDRVAVLGIGGLGHLAVQFLDRWGCEVTAFTSDAKRADALALGADDTLSSRDSTTWRTARGRFDFVLSTVDVALDLSRLLATLRPEGRLHLVGVTLEAMPLRAGSLFGQRSISASSMARPATVATMLDFAARHDVRPVVEQLPMTRVDEAYRRLAAGDVRHRVVLTNDLT